MHDKPVLESPDGQDAQSSAPALTKEEQIAQEREKLERRLASGELDDVRTRVAYILNQYPTARNSDVDLTIRYWKMFHPDDVGREFISYDALRTVTAMTSITRARATIQNTFKLFVPEDEVSDFRAEKEAKVRGKQRAVRTTVEESKGSRRRHC